MNSTPIAMLHTYTSITKRPEENKVHGFLADVVVLVEVVFNHESQFVDIHHLSVGLCIILRVDEVTEHETSKVIFLHHS